MIIDDILNMNPEMEKILMDAGIKCFGWGGALYMTLEQAALKYRLNADELLEKLNNKLN